MTENRLPFPFDICSQKKPPPHLTRAAAAATAKQSHITNTHSDNYSLMALCEVNTTTHKKANKTPRAKEEKEKEEKTGTKQFYRGII